MQPTPVDELMFKTWRSDDQSHELSMDMIGQQLLPQRLVKSAAARVFDAATLRDLTPPDGWWGSHNVAVGSLENWGFNRNGDGFPRDILTARHPTFVKHGRVYRNHAHKDPSQILGIVKAAAYNHALDRVEVISWLKKSASEAEYESARGGKQLTYSMSAHMPWDTCSVCAHKARSDKQRCPDLKKGSLLEYNEGLQKYAFMINDSPDLVFFDNSVVPRPADRSAQNLAYFWAPGDRMVKAASAGSVISGSEIARSVDAAAAWSTSPLIPIAALLTPSTRASLVKLAAAETYLRGALLSNVADSFTQGILKHARSAGSLTQSDIVKLRAASTGTLFYHLAKSASVLPLADFAAYILECSPSEAQDLPVVKQAACCLPTLFNDILASIDEAMLPMNLGKAFDSSSEAHASVDPGEDEVQDVMEAANKIFGVKPERCEQRAMHIIVKQAGASVLNARGTKEGVSKEAQHLANVYGLYKLAALRDISAAHTSVTPDFFEAVIAGLNFVV